MKIDIGALLSKAVAPLVAAVVIGLGSAVLSGSSTNAVQAQQIDALNEKQRRTEDAIDKLNVTTAKLDKNVAVLAERLRRE